MENNDDDANADSHRNHHGSDHRPLPDEYFPKDTCSADSRAMRAEVSGSHEVGERRSVQHSDDQRHQVVEHSGSSRHGDEGSGDALRGLDKRIPVSHPVPQPSDRLKEPVSADDRRHGSHRVHVEHAGHAHSDDVREVHQMMADRLHLDPHSARATAVLNGPRNNRKKLETALRNDSLSSDPSDCVRPPPPKPHKHKRGSSQRQRSLSSSDDEVCSSLDCSSCDELESESVSEKGTVDDVSCVFNRSYGYGQGVRFCRRNQSWAWSVRWRSSRTGQRGFIWLAASDLLSRCAIQYLG